MINRKTNAFKCHTLKYLSQLITPLLYRFVDVGLTNTELGGSPNYQSFSETNDTESHLAIPRHPPCRTTPLPSWEPLTSGERPYPALEELYSLRLSIQGLRRLSLRNQPHLHQPHLHHPRSRAHRRCLPILTPQKLHPSPNPQFRQYA